MWKLEMAAASPQGEPALAVELQKGGTQMIYKKISVELIVIADEADAVVAELNSDIDRLEERHTVFGGGMEIVAIQHTGTRKKTAFMHTLSAGEIAVDAIRIAREKVAGALKQII